MRLLRLIPELPLLRRELTELAARRRTYVVRIVGALVILSVAMFFVSQTLSSYLNSPYSRGLNLTQKLLGAGGVAFPQLVWLLFPAIQILMPSMVCGSITIEKERNTLGTLFVTRLSPMTIVLEKLGSRLVPMLSVLILAFPVLAFVYSLGGVDQNLLSATIWLVLWECLLYASIGLLCSSWYSTTVGAFIASYVLTGVLFTLTQIMGANLPTPFRIWVDSAMPAAPGSLLEFFRRLVPPEYPLVAVMLTTLPVMFFVGFCLLLTRFLLFRRAFVSQSSLLLRVFRKADAFFNRLNQRAGGVMIITDRESYPESDPVAWREREKKSLGKARYLIRMLLVLELPVLFFCLLVAIQGSDFRMRGLSELMLVIWAVVMMILTVKASTLLSSERARETMDALLSTPMTGASILVQKVMGMNRLMLVLAAPIMSVHLTLMLMYMNFSLSLQAGMLLQLLLLCLYGGFSLLSTWILMHTIAWVAINCGARSLTQARSVMTALIVLGSWIFLSWTVLDFQRYPFMDGSGSRGGYYNYNYGYDWQEDSSYIGLGGRTLMRMMRIDGVLQANDELLTSITSGAFRSGDVLYLRESVENPVLEFIATLWITGWHCGLCWGLRRLALRRSPKMLGRNDEELSLQPESIAGLQPG